MALPRREPYHHPATRLDFPTRHLLICVAQNTRLPDGVESTPSSSATTTYTGAARSEQPIQPSPDGETQLERTHQPKPSPKHHGWRRSSCLSLILHISPDSPGAALMPAPCRRPFSCFLRRICRDTHRHTHPHTQNLKVRGVRCGMPGTRGLRLCCSPAAAAAAAIACVTGEGTSRVVQHAHLPLPPVPHGWSIPET